MAMVREFISGSQAQLYSPDPGLPEALQAVARFLRQHKDIGDAAPDRIILTCGANQAYVNAVLTVTQPGDEVVVLSPYYFDHVFAIQLANCAPIEVPMVVRDRRFVLDFDALEAALTPRTRCITLVSPANPAGSCVSPNEVRRLCELCAERGLWLISDETYDLLTFPPARHVSPAALEVHDRVIVLGSFSKTFGLAAWRIGYLFGPSDMVEECIKVQDAVVVCAPVPSQLAAMGALDEADSFVPAARTELLARREAMLEVLDESDLLDATVPDGATFVLARLTLPVTSLDFSRRLVEEAGLVTVPGSAFGPHGEGWVRFSFGNQPPERIREAGARLAMATPSWFNM